MSIAEVKTSGTEEAVPLGKCYPWKLSSPMLIFDLGWNIKKIIVLNPLVYHTR